MNLTDINEIHELLGRHGFRFSKSLGQNFLTAAWVPEKIAESALLNDRTGVLEVGPGIGCLTEQLSKRAGRVLAVELDKALKPVLSETLHDCKNVELIIGDVLKQDIKVLVREHFEGLRPVICANLPYNVTTPLLTAFINAECFEEITVMIQREVGRRICAEANTKDYGAFGVFVQWYYNTELLFDVPPSCFIPQPKVTSCVIRLTRREKPPVDVCDEALMFRIIRAAFNQRRKTLINAISANISEISKEQLENVLNKCGFDTRIRGETLNIGGFAIISDEIGKLISADL